MSIKESRTERITLRWPAEIQDTLIARSRANKRSLSAEVRELLTYARNTIPPGLVLQDHSWSRRPSTSVSLTPRLRAWLSSYALFNGRSIQVELVMLTSFALDDIMNRDLALIARWSEEGPTEPGPEQTGTAEFQPGW